MGSNMRKVTMGMIVVTAAVSDALAQDTVEARAFSKYVSRCLGRHSNGDWGDMDDEDKKQNDRALLDDCRIMSSYGKGTDDHIWIITEADRSVTTVLFPSDY